jgi:hypothetical protein
MAYTRDGIMAQIWVAFGQGTGEIRVSHEAVMELHRWYYNAIGDAIVDKYWEKYKVAALERVRAVGRLAAATAIGIGSTMITPEQVDESVQKVKAASETWICPTTPGVPAEIPESER